MSLNPLIVLRQASKKVPSLKYATGVLGLISVLVVARMFQVAPGYAWFGVIGVVALMVILYLFASAVAHPRALGLWPILFLIWCFLILAVLSAFLFFASLFFNWPKPFNELITDIEARESKADTQNTPTNGPGSGFVYLKRMYFSHDPPNDGYENEEVTLPLTSMDTSFRQAGGTMFHGGGAESAFKCSDLPPGVVVECDGTVDHTKRWAVLRPYDGLPVLDGDIFRLGLYADVGSDTSGGGANVHVDVWYKKK